MKHLKLAILLVFICWNTFEITAQVNNDSVSIQKSQIKNIYVGLKQGEAYKNYYFECLQVSNELNQIINNQDQELQKSLKQITVLNSNTEALNQKIIEANTEIKRLESKKIPIWKHPILYGLLGFIGGIYLTK